MTIDEYENHINADENAKIANAGIIIVGKGDKVRALMAYGGGPKGCVGYAQAANKYKEVFGDKVNIYCMVIPTAVEFYCPDKAKKRTNQQLPTIRNVVAHLDPGVKPVDVYTTLGKHANEDIYLRTDHHWSPLGGYYAAQEFARVAGVPFKDLSHYERRVTHGYVGSMYGYSKDISIKNAPEDFVYYVPKGVEYTTTYTNYTINKNYQVTGEGKPFTAPFFFKFKDGHGGAYCTMMGGDTKLTQVRTSTHNGRRVIILKDSFGNMLPGYLFFSFEEVHVIDSRYFTKDIIAYVEENKITDILFANNIFKAYSSHTYGSYLCGKGYFINYQTGKASREPLDLGNVVKGTMSLDPELMNLYVGQGVPRQPGPFGCQVFDLLKHERTFFFGPDSKAWRGWNAFDSNAIVVGGYLFWCGENGSVYKYERTQGSLRRVSVMRYRAGGMAPGIESSLCVYRNYCHYPRAGYPCP